MQTYGSSTPEVPVTFTEQEIKALREAASALGYNIPGLTSAQDKLRVAQKGVGT